MSIPKLFYLVTCYKAGEILDFDYLQQMLQDTFNVLRFKIGTFYKNTVSYFWLLIKTNLS